MANKTRQNNNLQNQINELITTATKRQKPEKILQAKIITKGKKVIAICGISQRIKLPVLFLAVKKEHQKKGIGTKLTNNFLKETKNKIIFLTVKNPYAKKIYKKNGFKKIAKIGKKEYMIRIRGIK